MALSALAGAGLSSFNHAKPSSTLLWAPHLSWLWAEFCALWTAGPAHLRGEAARTARQIQPQRSVTRHALYRPTCNRCTRICKTLGWASQKGNCRPTRPNKGGHFRINRRFVVFNPVLGLLGLRCWGGMPLCWIFLWRSCRPGI